jgi:multiple sugar transport system permease protein
MLSTGSAFRLPYTLKNYSDIIATSGVFRWFFNSVVVASLNTLATLILASLAGYGFARTEFPFKNVIFVVVLLGLAIPEQAVIIARHQMFTDWKMHNTYLALILPGLSNAFGVFLMTQYFRSIPRDIDEAAMLDNASRFKIFWKVLLPLTVPAQATLGIFTFLACWNDYLWPLISATKPEMFTLTIGIASTQTNFAQSEGLGFLMAQAVFAGLPVFVVYLFFQRYIIQAVAGAAIR